MAPSSTAQAPERQGPPVHDSDLMWLAIKRLKSVARKMERLEYDEELEQLMRKAAEWFEWASYNIARRAGVTALDAPAAPASPADGIRAFADHLDSAYPEDVFAPLSGTDQAAVDVTLGTSPDGISRDRVSADVMRRAAAEARRYADELAAGEGA